MQHRQTSLSVKLVPDLEAEKISTALLERFVAEYPDSFSPSQYDWRDPQQLALSERPSNSVCAVGFDLYDTLITTTAQEPGVLCSQSNQDVDHSAICRSIEFLDIFPLQDVKSILAQFQAGALQQKQPIELRPGVNVYPEMDAPSLWGAILKLDPQTAVEFATAFELFRAQYTVMPGVPELLADLKAAQTPCGIISNAQVYTIPIARKVFERAGVGDFDQIFPAELRLFSHQTMVEGHFAMKPTLALFEELLARFSANTDRKLAPSDVLFVGNCERNDGAARDIGMRFALCTVVPEKVRRLEDGVDRTTLDISDYFELPQRFQFA